MNIKKRTAKVFAVVIACAMFVSGCGSDIESTDNAITNIQETVVSSEVTIVPEVTPSPGITETQEKTDSVVKPEGSGTTESAGKTEVSEIVATQEIEKKAPKSMMDKMDEWVGYVMDVNSYKAAYKDLQAIWGDVEKSYVEHYINHGVYEETRRIGIKFDPLEYSEAYPDVAVAYGTDILGIIEHYINYGMQEGRTAGTCAGYADLYEKLMAERENMESGSGEETNSESGAGEETNSGSVAVFNAPNAKTALWREFTPKAGDDEPTYASPVMRLGHFEDGSPYLLFGQQYYSEAKVRTWWASKPTAGGHWFELSFPEEKTFNKIDLYFLFNNPEFNYIWKEYRISYWENNQWVELLSISENNELEVSYQFEPVTSSKIRLDVVNSGDDNYARLCEIEVYGDTGENLAIGATATADSYIANGDAKRANDGYRRSFYGNWRPDEDAEGPHWVQLDFGKVVDINEMFVSAPDNSAAGVSDFVDYEFQYNKGTVDEPVWEVLKRVEGNIRGNAYAQFDTVSTQQVRFVVTKCNTTDAEAIGRPEVAGFRVYNRPSNENLAVNATATASSEDLTMGMYADAVVNNDSIMQISCITLVDMKGNVILQKGEPSEKGFSTSALPIQIYDIDNDGVEEIIMVYNDRIQICSPDLTVEKETMCPISAAYLTIGNISGNEKPQDIVLKDGYRTLCVYNNNLELLWSYDAPHDEKLGHYPSTYDVDNDGKDEVVVGNCLLDHDGTMLQHYVDTVYGKTQHSDSIRVGEFDPEQNGPEIILAHSENGNIFVNYESFATTNESYTHDELEHSQKFAAGEFCPTIPGTEIFTSMKNDIGIYLHKGNGDRIWPDAVYYPDLGTGVLQMDSSSFILAGSGQEYMFAPRCKTVIDGYNNKIVELPSDAYSQYGKSVDIDGDHRDELISWNRHRVQIWTNVAVVPDGGKNLCLTSTVTTDSTATGYNADSLIDGNRESTMWVSQDVKEEHYILVDFGSEKTFDELWLYHYDDVEDTYYLDDFRIQYNAGTLNVPVWVDIYDIKGNMKKEAAFTFDAVTAQQVRILIEDPTTAHKNLDSVARVCEIEIYEALSNEFTEISGVEQALENTKTILFDAAKSIDGISLSFTGEVKDYVVQYNSGSVSEPVWSELKAILCNNTSVNEHAFTPISTDALRVIVTDGEGAVQSISARQWSGYEYQEIENILIDNPTKSGIGGSYKWTNY